MEETNVCVTVKAPNLLKQYRLGYNTTKNTSEVFS